jgi:hypothetical protein
VHAFASCPIGQLSEISDKATSSAGAGPDSQTESSGLKEMEKTSPISDFSDDRRERDRKAAFRPLPPIGPEIAEGGRSEGRQTLATSTSSRP